MRYRYDAKADRIMVLDERTGKWKPDRSRKNAGKIVAPSVMPDIRAFVAVATEKPMEITSRSQLGRYERSNNIRQCGDYRPGEVIERRKKRVERELGEAKRLGGGVNATWTDFR